MPLRAGIGMPPYGKFGSTDTISYVCASHTRDTSLFSPLKGFFSGVIFFIP
jgi:hypothetical protein